MKNKPHLVSKHAALDAMFMAFVQNKITRPQYDTLGKLAAGCYTSEDVGAFLTLLDAEIAKNIQRNTK